MPKLKNRLIYNQLGYLVMTLNRNMKRRCVRLNRQQEMILASAFIPGNEETTPTEDVFKQFPHCSKQEVDDWQRSAMQTPITLPGAATTSTKAMNHY